MDEESGAVEVGVIGSCASGGSLAVSLESSEIDCLESDSEGGAGQCNFGGGGLFGEGGLRVTLPNSTCDTTHQDGSRVLRFMTRIVRLLKRCGDRSHKVPA